MIAINCLNCGNTFKISGADLIERQRDGILDLCPACSVEKSQVKEPEEIVEIEVIEEPKKRKK